QRPWSEWKHTDASCIEHTGHDVEQVQELYSTCEEPLIVQVACDFRHRIVHVSECYHGSIHDITILRESGLLEHVEESVQIIGDKGYIGEEYVVTPRKKPRGCELTEEDKDFNRDINSARAAIENINQSLKSYAIVRYRFALGIVAGFPKVVQPKRTCQSNYCEARKRIKRIQSVATDARSTCFDDASVLE
ncbi:unnamed protein product, partial [Rotaria sp. Silwood1]